MLTLIIVPFLAAAFSFLIRNEILRRALLVCTALFHTAVTAALWAGLLKPTGWRWLALDPPGLLFLGTTSVLFLAASFYAVGYLRSQPKGMHKDTAEDSLFSNASEAVFCACAEVFLGTMSIVSMSQHLGFIWVAMEATTLATAPLIYFHRHSRSLEATWKYLLLCSVGISFALLGNFFMVAASAGSREPVSFILGDIAKPGVTFDPLWLKAAFIFFLVGYGTKMGLAPMHTWLPDAHSEAPSVVSALLSGALLNCAFLGIFRTYQVCLAHELGGFCRELLLAFGFVSLIWAAVFILRQKDYKRMLAYSSVEHMGILAIGVGVGGDAIYGSMLHAMGHSLGKGALFMTAGNMVARFKTKAVSEVKGVLAVMPRTGTLWLAGLLAITGIPPFSIFLSKFIIARAMLEQGHVLAAGVFLAALVLIAVGMSSAMLKMACGCTDDARILEEKSGENLLVTLPPAVLLAASLALGICIPPFLDQVLNAITVMLGDTL
jgi:hydrogenase-4 component F